MNACSARCGFCGRCTDRQGDEGTHPGYRCVQPGCSWRGLAVAAYQHHIGQGHHPIELINGVRAQFSCCPGTAARKSA